MNLHDALTEIAGRLDTIEGLNVFPFWPDNVTAPAVLVYPVTWSFDATYRRGRDTAELEALVVVDKPTDRSSWQQLSPFISGSGSQSIKQAIDESGPYTSFETAYTQAIQDAFLIVTMAGVERLSATFTIMITGEGEEL